MTTVTMNVFNVTNRCPVCGGAANIRYHSLEDRQAAGMKRKCGDCGFTWAEAAVRRSL